MICDWCEQEFFPGEDCFMVAKGVIAFGETETFVPEKKSILHFHNDCFEDFQIITRSGDSNRTIPIGVGS
jgi:hypothetical protein